MRGEMEIDRIASLTTENAEIAEIIRSSCELGKDLREGKKS